MSAQTEITQEGDSVAFAQAEADRGMATRMAGRQPAAPTGAVETVPVLLDESAWPIVHGSRGSMDNSALPQPTKAVGAMKVYTSAQVADKDTGLAQLMVAAMLRAGGRAGGSPSGGAMASQAAALLDFSLPDANPVSIITEKLSDTEQVLWTSTIGNILAFKQTRGNPNLELLAVFERELNFRFHGSYALVGKSGPGGSSGFITTLDEVLLRYQLQKNRSGRYEIVETGRLSIPTPLNPDGSDHLVGITVLDDGTLVASSKHGTFLAARSTAQGQLVLVDTMSLGDYTKTDNAEVSNSISSSGQAVYVATQREMARVDFDAAARKFLFKWTTVYGPVEPWYVGRLGPGSGSTPTTTMCQDKELVTITDGALPMNILWYDTADGKLVGSRKVQFKADENGNLPTTSEQSVAVDGCRAFVVQNYMGMEAVSPDVYCTIAPQGGELRAKVPDFCATLMPANSTDLFIPRSCPASLGCASFGAAVYEINPASKQTDGLSKVSRVWARDDVSCGTSIPLISQHKGSNVAYCVGLKPGNPLWGMLGMDMSTGKDALDVKFFDKWGTQNHFANPFYAGVEAIGPNEMVVGSVGGLIYVSPDSRSSVKKMSDGLSLTANSIFSGDFSKVDPGFAALLAAIALALLAMVAFVFKKAHKAMSPRLPN